MQYINFDALHKNVAFFKNNVQPAKLCAVLKNDAYGHGLIHVASSICGQVDCFAVGCVEEAEQIAFLNKDVLILLPPNQTDTERAIRKHFILVLDSFETLNNIAVATQNQKCFARVHIKIDSGMSRFGFRYEDLGLLTEQLKHSQVIVEGIFSHFYGTTKDLCDRQMRYFDKCLECLKSVYPDVICHIANTAGTLLSAEYRMDMVRIGLGLYGYGDDRLVPVKSVYAEVLAVKNIVSDSTVGYGPMYIAGHSSRIAILNIGYANGFPRVLVGSKILIKQQLYPVIAVCMGTIIVDIFDADIRVGDKATLLGDGVNIANDKIIIYELLCNLR